MKRGRANGKYGKWARAIRGELAGVCERLDMAEAEAVAAERARLEAALAAIDALIHARDEAAICELRAGAAEGLVALRELVASTVIEFEAASPTLALPREGTVKGRIL